MSPVLGVLLMMNNYFHDVATALLLASGIAMAVMDRKLGAVREPEVARYFLGIYGSMTKLARFALVWIIVGGVPRVLTYREFEWANAAGRNQVPALIVKHVLFIIAIGSGALLWRTLAGRARELKKSIADPEGRP